MQSILQITSRKILPGVKDSQYNQWRIMLLPVGQVGSPMKTIPLRRDLAQGKCQTSHESN